MSVANDTSRGYVDMTTRSGMPVRFSDHERDPSWTLSLIRSRVKNASPARRRRLFWINLQLFLAILLVCFRSFEKLCNSLFLLMNVSTLVKKKGPLAESAWLR